MGLILDFFRDDGFFGLELLELYVVLCVTGADHGRRDGKLRSSAFRSSSRCRAICF